MTKSKLSPVAFGAALGVAWGVSVLCMGLFANMFMNGKPIVGAVGQMYLAYTPSVLNSFIGAGGGLVGAFIAGYVVAWLYNLFCDWPFF